MENKVKAWRVFVVVYIASVVIPMCQFKVPPLMPLLIKDLGIGMGTAGFLMSIFAVAGIIIAIPAAMLLTRLGPKKSGMIALGCAVLGSVIGAMAQGAATILIGRTIEGISVGLIAVVAPAAICMWFPPEKRGLPMGIWATWVPVGLFIIFNIAGPLSDSFGWQGVWWFTAIVCFAELILYAIVVDAPDAATAAVDTGSEQAVEPYAKALLNPKTWIIAFVFMAFNVACMSFNTWEASFLQTELDFIPANASFQVSLMNLVYIPASIVAGMVLNMVRKRHMVFAASMLAYTIVIFWCFKLTTAGAVMPYMVILGIVTGFVPPCAFTLAAESMKSIQHAGLAMAIVGGIGQNLGLFIGPPIIGAIAQNHGWGATALPVAAASAIGFLIALAVRPHKLSFEKES
ncbi:MAG: MFS transporter [Desulfobacterales bacterium]|nr:MFS transporter [Desulfobacterales bacterium]MDD4071591.1 MFS transporter [Desulfobacterales bacterium]MDD4392627.1 MFS transporter [Desulfobacterales bacterium]